MAVPETQDEVIRIVRICHDLRVPFVARGSGTTVQQVNQLLNARKQMAKMVKQMGKGKMPNLQSIAAAQRRR